MKKPESTQKKPKRPNANRRPINVMPYFKKGKKVSGYKRRRAGDAVDQEERKK